MMETKLRPNHQIVLDKFVQACQADEGILAAFLVGSYAKGKDDEHSDLDLYLITTNDAYDDFVSRRESFVRLLGEPLFMEDFELSDIVFLIFPDGSEVEIHYAPERQLGQVFNEPFKVLLDKKNITTGVVAGGREVDKDRQTEKLRRLIYWFWHDFSHFLTAMSRNRLWWAHGQLDVLRSMCVGLARLKNNFLDLDVEEEVYFKIENALPVEELSALQRTFCPMEKEMMLKSGSIIVQFYKELAIPLANLHGIPYPERLERVMLDRMERLSINA